jgi:hypothetical protein
LVRKDQRVAFGIAVGGAKQDVSQSGDFGYNQAGHFPSRPNFVMATHRWQTGGCHDHREKERISQHMS